MANNVIALREAKGLTQERFAELCGISRASIARYESGEDINRSNAIKIANTCGVSVDFVLGVEDSDKDAPPVPLTPEARILVAGVDRMPEAERKKAVNIMKTVFEQYKDLF